MFDRLSRRITDQLEENCTISHEDRELYEFGLRQGFTSMLNILTAAAVGAVFGCTLKALLFMGLYIPLRSFAGGHHARTPMICYIQSVVMLVAVCLYIKFVPCGWWEYIVIAAAAAVIYLLAPVETENKPLDENERRVYRKKALIILSAQAFLFPIMRALGAEGCAQINCCVIGMMSLMLVICKLENSKRK